MEFRAVACRAVATRTGPAARRLPRIRGRARCCGLALLLALAPALASADPAALPVPDVGQAKQIVEDLHAEMLGVMKEAETLGYEGRLARLQPAIAARYDFPFIAEKSVGRAWKGFDEAQRAELVTAIEHLAGATYAGRMSGFDGEKFETLGTEEAGQQTVLIRTRIVEADGKVVPLDYRLRSTQAGPRIVDVFYDGTVSELAMRRSEYSSLLRKGGLDALLEALDSKAAEQVDDGKS